MSSEDQIQASPGPGANKILQLLAPIKQDSNGAALFEYIEQLLGDTEQQHREIEITYAELFDQLLDGWARQLPGSSPLRLQIKLLQLRLTPPISPSDLAKLREHARAVAETPTSESMVRAVLAPLLTSGAEEVEISPPPQRTPRTQPEQIDAAYRQHMDDKRQTIHKLQEGLGAQIAATVRLNDRLGRVLDHGLQSLEHLKEAQGTDTLRQHLLEELRKLTREQGELAAQLKHINAAVTAAQADGQRLSDELTRIHLLSLTDDLTGLANRRAFMRRLKDEVSRVQRYGNPLSLALLDLDDFKSINDRYGHAAGDEVLKAYAAEILSIFRHHDLVSRYGGEEFAILLPNTHSEGALRALRKVQKRAADTTYQFNGQALALPTFSAGLVLFRPGETAEDLIQRADQALYSAKHQGRNRIEFEHSESASTSLG